MEELSCQVMQHEVSRVSISNAKDVRRHALTSKRVQVVIIVLSKALLNCMFVFSPSKLLSSSLPSVHHLKEEVQDAFLSEWASVRSFILVHLRDHRSVVDELNVTSLEACLHHVIAHHSKIIAT